MPTLSDKPEIPRYRPTYRPLRVYALDPKLTGALEPPVENQLILKVPWEDLMPGPVGEYLEIIDFDPESDCFYWPIDLNSPPILAQAGIAPAEGDPYFHQQFVYAVVMTTLRYFELALGRTILWAAHRVEFGQPQMQFVRRLRIYPHALRAANAYYSPAKKALLLGYFSTAVSSAMGSTVRTASFSCLSHGILAHETTHAVLDGLKRIASPSDTGSEEVAVQEGIADAIALLQQFAVPGFLASQLHFGSDLDRNGSLLEELARRLAQPAGIHAEMRRKIGLGANAPDSAKPFGLKLQDRSAVLVAALFRTFLRVGRKRTNHLLGLAGIAAGKPGDLNETLLDAIASELAGTASHLVRMCIRAIDYCPPVDVSHGDYLRAMVTADVDVESEDEAGFRTELVTAFRAFGLYPADMVTMSPLELVWRSPSIEIELPSRLQDFLTPVPNREAEFKLERSRCLGLQSAWRTERKGDLTMAAAREMGLACGAEDPRTIEPFTVDTFRLAQRSGADGEPVTDWVITISQQRRGYLDVEMQNQQDKGKEPKEPDFVLRGGCALLIDARTLRARYCISKDILSARRLAGFRGTLQSQTMDSQESRPKRKKADAEPFLALRAGLSVQADWSHESDRRD